MSRHPGIGSGLVVSGVSRQVGNFCLNADFHVLPGERAGISGRSGCGKTTLLRILAGLEPLEGPAAVGRIFLDGREITRLRPERREVGIVFQDPTLFPAMSVLENAAYGLRVRGMPREERIAIASEWLDKVGLGALADQKPERLSGGERQRVAWIRALVWKPRLILLDEPFSALDSGTREGLRRELVAMHSLWPAPLLLVSHDASELEALATVRLRFEESGDRKERRFRRDFDR